MKQKEIDNLKSMYEHYNYKCFVCSKEATNRAHILGQGKVKRNMYGSSVIDNPLNWLPACNKHNDLIDMSNNQLGSERVALIIESEVLEDDEKRDAIESIVKENIKRKEQKSDRTI